MDDQFVELTELAGDDVTAEQVERICQRYYWAGEYCRGKDVLEVACGSGQGVGYLGGLSRSIVAGDYSESILAIARKTYGDRFPFRRFDAQKMPFPAESFDVVLIFEAIYYLPDVEEFFRECRRILRPGGTVLIASANKDLFDFTPSANSYTYFNAPDLVAIMGRHGFKCSFFGGFPIEAVSARQKILRPVKMIASRLGLIPKSMTAKKFLKRFVFGSLVPMPSEILAGTCNPSIPVSISSDSVDREHKVIFCAARLIA